MAPRSATRNFSAAIRLRTLSALVGGILLCGATPTGFAAAAAQAPATGTGTATLPGSTRNYQISLKQLGALYPLQLRGVEGTNGIPFSIRSDEIVTSAKLKLNYAYSPALLSEWSHINVIVNGEVAASLPVPQDQGGKNLTREIDIPTRLISEFNRLNLQLIGHYTRECEDPAHSSLWANISNDSVLDLTVSAISLENDLALLPHPFFDRRDVRQLTLPFVFAAAPSPDVLEAAGVLSSWFGALAEYRGARFPVATSQIPARGNAVIFALANERIPGIQWPAAQGPTLSIESNPNDPTGKLLLVLGRDAAELKAAATALAIGSSALSGQTATIGQLVELRPRKPYDAPNWLPSDRAVKFGELAEQSTLNVAGYSPDLIRVNFHMPPDLFAWRSKGIPVDLRYRYTPRPSSDKSTLNVNVNQRFLHAFPLLSANHDGAGSFKRVMTSLLPDGSAVAHEQFHIPLFMLPSQGQMQFHYYYDYVKQGACKDVILDNVRGAIEPDSTIDISGFPHFMAMPDLAAFGNSGFPFTRMADLSDTAVVLPDAPDAADYSAYLTLLGRLGSSTGYPATAVTVAQPQQVQDLADKDLLVIGSGGNQPLLGQWKQYIPVGFDGDAKRFPLSDMVYRLFSWRDADPHTNASPGHKELAFRSSGSDAVIAGFESPLSSGRSVVLLSSAKPAGLSDVVDVLLDAELVKKVQGSAVVIRGKQVDSLVADQTYYVGRLNPLLYVQWFLSNNPLLLALAGIACALLLAIVLYLTLRARARQRLGN